MPRDPSGVAAFPAGTRGVAGTVIESAKYNAMLDDAESMLSDCVNVDGTTPFAANQSMGNNQITNLADGTTASRAANIGQVATGALARAVTVAGTGDAITLAYTIPFTSYTTGMNLSWITGTVNTGAATVAVDGMAAKALRKLDSIALSANDTGPAGYTCRAEYDGTRFILMNPYTLDRVADQTISSTDASGTVGPTLNIYRNSASPAAADVLGSVDFLGNDSGGNSTIYASARADIADATNGSEAGIFRIQTMKGGTRSDTLMGALGFYTPSVTDQGVDTFNALDLYVNSVKLPRIIRKAANETRTATVTLAADSDLTFAIAAASYKFEFDLYVDTPAAADFKFDLDSTGTAPSTVHYSVLAIASDSATTPQMALTSTALNTVHSILAASGSAQHIQVKGIILAAGAGNFRLRWAQNTSNAGNTIVRRGSELQIVTI